MIVKGRRLKTDDAKAHKQEMAANKDQDFLEYLIKSIVNNPNDVKVERKVDEMGVLLTLHVNPADMAQVIGRSGATAQSIRSLLRIVGLKNSARVNLKIAEPEGAVFKRTSTPEINKTVEDIKI